MRVPLAIPAALAILGTSRAEEKTSIAIEGSGRPQSEILSALGGRLEHIRNRPTTPSRAADAAFLVEQLLIDSGFNEVSVTPEILGPRKLRLTVEDGPRDTLGEVTVLDVPNRDLNETLQDLFRSEPRKRARGFGEPPVSDEDIEVGLRLMKSQMRSMGFYDAEISLVEQSRNPETGKIDFTFDVDPGKIAAIARPRFTGAEVPGIRGELEKFIGLQATTSNLNSMRARVVERCQALGFVNAEVRTSLDTEGNTVRPVYEVSKGQPVTVREIRVEGYEKTDPGRITRRLEGLAGSPLDGNAARDRIGELLATGAFSSLQTDFEPVGDGLVDATLRVREAEARGVSFTLGADSYEGVIVGAKYFDRNFRGKIRNFSAGFEASGRALLGEISLTDPWLFGSDARGTARLFAQSRDFEGYNSVRSGLEGVLEYPLDENHSLSLRLGAHFNTTTPDGLAAADLGETDYLHTFITLNQVFEYRDNPLLPASGWHFESPVTVGAALGGSVTTSYAKLAFNGSYHHPIGESGRLGFGLRGGLIIPGGDETLPIDLRTFTGGSRSVRSFPERELGPLAANGFAVGGEAHWVANLEYSRPIAGPLRGVAFVDAGGLTRQWEDLGLTSPEVAVGLGLRLDLPVGPVRFEYGYNLTRDVPEPDGTFHFAIGATF